MAQMIEEMILEYQPTMLIVDHDMRFRQRIATRFPAVVECRPNEKIGEMKAANRIKPVYLLTVNIYPNVSTGRNDRNKKTFQ